MKNYILRFVLFLCISALLPVLPCHVWGETLTGYLDPDTNLSDEHTLTLSRDTEITITGTIDDTLYISSVKIYESDGETQIWNGYGQGDPSKTYSPVAIEAGTYIIRVTLATNLHYYGAYTLQIDRNEPRQENETEPNDEASQATTIALGTDLNGHLGYTGGGDGEMDTVDWWTITLPEDTELTFTGTIDDTLYTSSIKIYESDGETQIWNGYGQGDPSKTYSPVAMEAGTYYIKVTLATNLYYYGGYTFEIAGNEPLQENETEPNDTYSQATQASIGSGLMGHLGYTGGGDAERDTVDWWTITLPQETELTFTCTKDDTLSVSSVRIYDIDGETQLWAGYGPGSSETSKTYSPVTLEAGTYYIKVSLATNLYYYGGYSIDIAQAASTTTTTSSPNTTTSTTAPATTTTSSTTTTPAATTTTSAPTSTTTAPAGDLSISGTVYGDVIEGVSLYLYGPPDQVTITGPEGDYSFDGLAAGTYTVVPVYGRVTFQPASRQVELTAQDETGVSFISQSSALTVDAAAASPDEVPDDGTTEVLFSVTISGATAESVTADLTPLGGNKGEQLYDDGTGGDAVAGDGIYSLRTTIAQGTPPGRKGLLVRAEDSSGRIVEEVIELTVLNRISDTVAASGSNDHTVENDIEGQTLVLRFSLDSTTRQSQDDGAFLDVLDPDGFIYRESIPIASEETQLEIQNASKGTWTLRVHNQAVQARTYSIETSSSGTGIIAGVVLNADTGEALDDVTVSTDGGGSAKTDDGFFVLIHPAGTFTVTVRAQGFVSASRSVTVSSEGPVTLDIALLPSDSGSDDEPVCALTCLLGETEPLLKTVRGVRDDVLAKTCMGQKVISLYYKNGKKMIAFCTKHPAVKPCIKKMLGIAVPVMTFFSN